jgi:hypothetical protein
MDIGRELAASGLNRSFDDKTLTNSLTAWESRVLSALQERYPDIAGELKYATRLPLHKLPVKMRSEFIAEYRSIIGLDHVLNTLGAPGFVPQTTINHLERNGIVGVYRSFHRQHLGKIAEDEVYRLWECIWTL